MSQGSPSSDATWCYVFPVSIFQKSLKEIKRVKEKAGHSGKTICHWLKESKLNLLHIFYMSDPYLVFHKPYPMEGLEEPCHIGIVIPFFRRQNPGSTCLCNSCTLCHFYVMQRTLNPGFTFLGVSGEGLSHGAHKEALDKRIQAKLGSRSHSSLHPRTEQGPFTPPWVFVWEEKWHEEAFFWQKVWNQ